MYRESDAGMFSDFQLLRYIYFSLNEAELLVSLQWMITNILHVSAYKKYMVQVICMLFGNLG